jgi:hypothetical protein
MRDFGCSGSWFGTSSTPEHLSFVVLIYLPILTSCGWGLMYAHFPILGCPISSINDEGDVARFVLLQFQHDDGQCTFNGFNVSPLAVLSYVALKQ